MLGLVGRHLHTVRRRLEPDDGVIGIVLVIVDRAFVWPFVLTAKLEVSACPAVLRCLCVLLLVAGVYMVQQDRARQQDDLMLSRQARRDCERRQGEGGECDEARGAGARVMGDVSLEARSSRIYSQRTAYVTECTLPRSLWIS